LSQPGWTLFATANTTGSGTPVPVTVIEATALRYGGAFELGYGQVTNTEPPLDTTVAITPVFSLTVRPPLGGRGR
jgi:hypothetical protein